MAGERQLPGLGLYGFWTLGSNGWKDQNDSNIRILSALVQASVMSFVATVPGTPTDGDRHVITSGGDLNKIAIRDNGAWVYLVPEAGWMVYDRDTATFKVFDGTDWNAFVSGGAGAWHVASGVPSDALGVDGDLYLDTATGDVYDKVAGTWGAASMNITGPAGTNGTNGTNGTDGKTILYGAVDPTTEGVNGDFYINTATDFLFGPKAAGTWPSGTSLVGPAGTNGTNGTNGTDGKTILYGAVNPTTEGVNGDFYINTATNFIFGPKAGGVWPSGTSLVGPAGSAGVLTAAAGTPSAGAGANGDLYINATTGDLYQKSGGSWGAIIGNIFAAGAITLANKTLNNTNTVTLKDALFTLQDDGDATKQMRFQLSGITAGQTRVLTPPDADTVLYGRSNLVGTVAQSGGAVTGDAMERSENKDGRYWKLADGTMRCSRDSYAVIGLATVENGVYTSATVTWTFPVAFAAKPLVQIVPLSAYQWGVVLSVSKTQVTFQIKSTLPTNYASVSLSAFGRWFANGLGSVADLFTGAQGGYYDISDLSSLFLDTAGTLPVTAVGQSVARVNDLSGSGNHLVQATSTKRPTIQMGTEGRPYLQFDGVDDFLASTATIDLSAVSIADVWFAGRKPSDTAAVRGLIEFGPTFSTTAGFGIVMATTTPNTTVGHRGATTSRSLTGAVTAGAANFITSGQSDIATPNLGYKKDNSAQATSTGSTGGGAYGVNTLYVGARAGTSAFFEGGMYEAGFRAGSNMSAAELAALHTLLNAKCGAF